MTDIGASNEIPRHTDIDHASMVARLTPWFTRQLDADELQITALSVPEGQGFSSETVLVDAAWQQEGDEQSGRFVLKAEPTGHVVFPTYDLHLQFEVMERVRRHSAVPAAPVRWEDPGGEILGRPSYVMDRVDGRVPPDNLPYTIAGWVLSDLEPQQRTTMIERSVGVLAGVATIDVDAAGLRFVDRRRYGPTGVDQQLNEWAAYLDFASPDRTHEAGAAALAKLRDTLPASPPPTGLNWGDSRIGNLMYGGDDGVTPVAVLDWEMASLGPAEVDLGWFLYMHRFFTTALGVPEPDGWPSEEAQIAAFESAIGRTLDDLDWYLLFAAYRYGMIMVKIVANQVAAGMEPLWGPDDNLAVVLMSSML
ncbi:MAG TPA: phosphotransferase family protein [Acidimicrobiales bacterium]